MSDLAFRLRIRNAANTTDDLVVTSVRSGTNPFIANVPSGDGQEVDLLTGAVRSGSYVVEVVDVVTGTDGTGTQRLVTFLLADSAGRQQLLSRSAFVEASADNFATSPSVWMGGYVTNVRQVDAITYAISVSDSRRVEQNHKAFTWGTNPQDSAKSEQVLFPQRGCLLGGPIIGGFGPTPDSGGIEAEFTAGETAIWVDSATRIAAFKWLAASDIGPDYTRVRTFGTYAPHANKVLAPFAESCTPGFYSDPVFQPLTLGGPSVSQVHFPNLRVYVTDGTTTWVGTLRAFFPWTYSIVAGQGGGGTNANGQYEYIYATFDASQPAFPSAGTPLRVRVVHKSVSQASPLYIDLHPVDIALKLFESVNIPVDTASANATKNALGPDMRLACRLTEPVGMGEFLSSALFGPFGFSARTNASGVREFFLTRRLSVVTPSVIINTDDVRGDDLPPVFDVDEGTVCSALRFEWRVLSKAITTPESNTVPPPDGIVESKQILELQSGDTSTFSTREVAYTIPGMVHHGTGWQSEMGELIGATAAELFDRYGRGAPTYDLPILASSAAASLSVGSEVQVNVAHVPNRRYRIGESTIGPRVAQIVRRDETPMGPTYKLVDGGPLAQVATTPTLTIAKQTLNPRTLAAFTITNAATLNAASNGVEVEYTTLASGTPTTNGTLFARYDVGAIPTTAQLLPAFPIGSRALVRARGTSQTLRPSAWSSWVAVQLDAWAAPSGLTIGTLTARSATVSWTNGNTSDPIDVYVYAGGSNPSDWQPYRFVTMSPTSTTTIVRGLLPSTAYRIAVAHRDMGTGLVSAYATNNFSTTGSTSITAPRVSNMQVIPTVVDSQFPSGIALGLWADDESLDIEIQRAPDVAGSPGTWTTIATVSGTTTIFGDTLPATGATFWYRSRHVGQGFTAGPYQNDLGPYLASAWPYPIVSGVVSSLPTSIARPSRLTPTLQVGIAPGSPNFVVKWSLGSVGQIEIWESGVPLSPQPTSPWTIPNPGPGASTTYTFYVYADGQLLVRDVIIQGFDPDELLPAGGTTGQVLAKASATSYDVAWTTLTSAGDVVGPSSSVDNAVARFDGTTGKLIQSSATMTLSDGGALDLGSTGSVETGAPGGSSAGVWKLGTFTGSTVSLDTTGYITIEIGGTTYQLALAI